MTLTAADKAAFDAESMLEAPRRSAVVSNPLGNLGIFIESNYSFADHKYNSGIYLLNESTRNHQELLVHGKSNKALTWITDSAFLYAREDNSSSSSILLFDVNNRSERIIYNHNSSISDIRIGEKNNHYRIIFSSVDNSLVKGPSNVHVYDHLFVRHWDRWNTGSRNTLYFIELDKKTENSNYFEISSEKAIDLLKETGLESPVEPFGGISDFDSNYDKLVFVAKDPKLNPATQTKTVVYEINLNTRNLKSLSTAKGACSSPRLAKDGNHIAWLEMQTPQYESDQNQIMVYESESGAKKHIARHWDRSPSSIEWGVFKGGEPGLFAIAENYGKQILFFVSIFHHQVIPMTEEHSVSSISVPKSSSLWLTKSSLINPPYYAKINVETLNESVLLENNVGLSPTSYEEIWFPGTHGHRIHAWIVKPESFDKSKKYPVAVLIHGGPQGSWTDSWSTRWNPAVFANAGFIVFALDPTGSTGYGQRFTDSIALDWGGKPYKDIELGVEYIKNHLSYADSEKMVALGASYGGYMINWIQGHPLGRQFRALVCHDGVFNTLNTFYNTEELYFPIHDFGGTPWENRVIYERWNPSNFVNYWATPELVIHSSKDYRLTESEGIAAFNVLQYKGIPSRLLVFEDENHWVIKPDNSLRWHKEVLSWILHYTKDCNANEDETF
ncbi:Dipeptidyl-peptidase V [Schizosaccharomyces pombe]